MDKLSYLSNADSEYIEQLYKSYQKDPSSVDPGWQKFFEGFEFARKNFSPASDNLTVPGEFKVINLINGYRQRGHLFTQTNPVRTRRKYSPTLDIENFGLSKDDLSKVFQAGNEIGIGPASLSKIIEHLDQTYCQSVGVEYAYIRNEEVFQWLRQKMESTRNQQRLGKVFKTTILRKLSEAVFLEKFLHKRFPGQKRFSLEGGESLIPALDAIIEKGAALGAEEFLIGMAHRGRLNVLANIMGKPYKDIFNEFSNKEFDDESLLGDVKYHLGATLQRPTHAGKKVYLTLAPNPSHLETVGPVVSGIARARIDQIYKGDTDKVVPIIIHGDASIAGQGVVYEMIQMSELEGYRTGGTVHLVVNNQVGFTTNYLDGRSSIYCTDVAKTIQSPIFHVNADDAEAVVYAIELAMEFREKFDKDVFIDLLGYRRYGHNEGDEPRFTQPVLYKAIEKHPDVRQIYVEKLISEGVITHEDALSVEKEVNDILEAHLAESHQAEKSKVTPFLGPTWNNIRVAVSEDFEKSPDTGVALKVLQKLGDKITILPKGKAFNRKLVKLMQDRNAMLQPGGKLDWAMGELLAYATLLDEGIPVRLSGQDSQRGTFSHRHSVLTIEDSEERYVPLKNISKNQAAFEVYNSPLSEYGVFGFDYGYSLSSPHTLTIWEAQFGDFFNGAQIIIDQYLSSAEDKWRVMSDLVLFLPHGYEGQGPEHSSGRIERFLSLCAENNMQVVNCTTPANFFHLLRRQVKRHFRKPLVVFTPKSLLRHASCVSSLEELSHGGFREVIDDDVVDPEMVKRVIFTSGKLYYELLEERTKRGTSEAIVRIEQLYPYPKEQIKAVLDRYPNADRRVWAQEEPANMGAWTFILRNFKDDDILLVARPESGSPATGSPKLHAIRQRKIVEKSFGECTCPNANAICKMVCAPHEWSFISETAKTE
ncbi:MAG: 2-oxoglutarate dehydrogenase E1 component [Bacteroidetes bacterium HGW-Bacteroidetes-11]|jgi:2-oxoglutarate dehydrogenase E1 component|nr:MAG: 2-oxoglutarate dehydrogenase E1 component [Bacteroidetes bacterium HGW-Bacteroidetes-11]